MTATTTNPITNRLLRANKRDRCPVCGHDSYCGWTSDKSLIICMREAKGAVGIARNGGHIHRLGNADWTPGRNRTFTVSVAAETADVSDLAERCERDALRQGKVDELARLLGLASDALQRLRVGWLDDQSCWTFPLSTANGRIVGINRRWHDGRKFVIRGQHIGLYLPLDLPADLHNQTLLICEGGTDTATALQLGFYAAGRFSAESCGSELRQLVAHRRPSNVVIMADREASGVGIRGAHKLAAELLTLTPDVRIVQAPSDLKDLRTWLQAGATKVDVQAAVADAEPERLVVRCANG